MTIAHPKHRKGRVTWLAITATAVIAVVAPAVWRSPTLLLWNASASVPVGLYLVSPGSALHANDLAVVELPLSVRALADHRQYLPLGVFLIKPVAATQGARICRHGHMIFVNDRWTGDAQAADHAGRPLPDWQGCRTLSDTQLFLMNPRMSDSFDGRYFGPIEQSLSHGRAWPLLTF